MLMNYLLTLFYEETKEKGAQKKEKAGNIPR